MLGYSGLVCRQRHLQHLLRGFDVEGRLAAALGGLDLEGSLAGRIASVIQAHAVLATADAREIEALRSRFDGRFPVISVSGFARDVVDLGGLFRFQEVAFSEAS